MVEKNVILTGFMGTGKSSVGRLLAMEMGREFLDMDNIIEQRERRTISRIFADEGEAYFRQLEADLCRELSGREGLVIATGGGTLVPQANLRALANTGLVICLDCEPAVLWERIGHSQNRPMLAAEDEVRFARLATLLAQRAPAYGRIQHHVDVTHLSKEEVVLKIRQLLKSQN
jgi:shikimate kinase